MRMPHVDDRVVLIQDIPELELTKGEHGVVRSMWCAPYMAFEVEFHPPGRDFQTRCLLAAEQVCLEDEPA